MIKIDSAFAKKLGFTSDKFTRISYLWKLQGYIMISFIESKEEGKGYLSQLFNNILEAGFGIKVPTPLGKMVAILQKKEFKRTIEHSEQMGGVEVWVKNNVEEKHGKIYSY